MQLYKNYIRIFKKKNNYEVKQHWKTYYTILEKYMYLDYQGDLNYIYLDLEYILF